MASVPFRTIGLQTITTAFIESTVNEVIAKRMVNYEVVLSRGIQK